MIKTKNFLNKISQNRFFKYLFESLSFILLISYFFLKIRENYHEFNLNNEYFSFALSLIPIIFLYFTLRLLLKGFSSAAITSTLILSLYKIDFEKYKNTGEHIYFKDLISFKNILIAKEYINHINIAIITIIFISLIIMIIVSIKKFSFFDFFSSALLSLLFFPFFIFYTIPFGGFIDKNFGGYLGKLNLPYHSWNISFNVKSNGLPVHILQTSRASIPSPEKFGINKFNALIKKENFSKNSINKRNIYIILCESCWFDENHFKEIFKPFFDIGFKDFRAISPIYGGGTVNSSFEILTGIPSSINLSGVIYQEYKDELSDKIYGIPNSLKNIGYKVKAFHNFEDDFWNRKTVMPKMGFEEYFGISSMSDTRKDDDPFPRDYHLYDFVLKKIEKQENGFYYLETVNSHSPYKTVKDYERKLRNTVGDMIDFLLKVRSKDKDALILVFADHKPGLNKFFIENGIIPKDYFNSDGTGFKHELILNQKAKNIIGDVPVLISTNDLILNEFIKKADRSSFFCLSKYLNDYFMGFVLPAHEYSRDICSEKKGYSLNNSDYEKWITYYSAFHRFD